MEKKYTIELTKEQLDIISRCVEDCCRFAAGQTELWNTTSWCGMENGIEVRDKLKELHDLVVPGTYPNEYYAWNGGNCPNDRQRKFIAQCYPIYREILHYFALENHVDNVYADETLTCEEGGPLPIIRPKND